MSKPIYEDKLMQELRRMRELPDDVRVKVLAAVSRQPAADVAPVVHGRWLETLVPDGYVPKASRLRKQCSVCGWTNACRYNFCPNCGAKMDGGNADGAGG